MLESGPVSFLISTGGRKQQQQITTATAAENSDNGTLPVHSSVHSGHHAPDESRRLQHDRLLLLQGQPLDEDQVLELVVQDLEAQQRKESGSKRVVDKYHDDDDLI